MSFSAAVCPNLLARLHNRLCLTRSCLSVGLWIGRPVSVRRLPGEHPRGAGRGPWPGTDRREEPKLGPRQVRLARDVYKETDADGKWTRTVQHIAEEFGVPRPTIYQHLTKL